MLWKGGAAARTTASLVVVTPLLKQSVMQVQHQMLPLERPHACRRRECTSGGLQRGWGQVIAKAAGSDAGMCEVTGETNVHPRNAIASASLTYIISQSSVTCFAGSNSTSSATKSSKDDSESKTKVVAEPPATSFSLHGSLDTRLNCCTTQGHSAARTATSGNR